MSTVAFFSFSRESFADMINVETICHTPPTYLDSGRLTLVGEVKTRLGSGRVRRDGARKGEIVFEGVSRVEARALHLALLGGYTVGSALLYFSWVDDLGWYTPFLGWIDRPDDYEDFTAKTLRRLVFPVHDYQPQSVTKTGNYTVTADDRLIYFDTTGGDITADLPDAASFEPWTPFAFVKTVAANTLTLDPDGAQTFDGASTKAITDADEQYQAVSDGSNWVSISDGD